VLGLESLHPGLVTHANPVLTRPALEKRLQTLM
jgi:hypothetical protein